MEILKADEFSTTWIAYQKERKEHPELHSLISTGVRALDNLLKGGYQRGQLFYVAGPQKAGKSTLLLNLALKASNQGYAVAYFGAEMTNMQMGNMVFANLSGVPRDKIRSVTWTDEDWEKLENAANVFGYSDSYWSYGLTTPQSILDALDEIESETKIDVVCIDYVQLMSDPENRRGGRQQELEAISRKLKQLTLRSPKPLAVLAAAQINRESIRNELYDPNSIAGSGAFERDCDILAIITDVKDDISKTPVPNRKRIHVVATRETSVGKVDIYYNGSISLMADIYDTNRIDLGD